MHMLKKDHDSENNYNLLWKVKLIYDELVAKGKVK